MAQDYNLSVRTPFASYATGDLITDQAAVKAILSSEQQHFVSRVVAPPPPPPAPPVEVKAIEPATKGA